MSMPLIQLIKVTDQDNPARDGVHDFDGQRKIDFGKITGRKNDDKSKQQRYCGGI